MKTAIFASGTKVYGFRADTYVRATSAGTSAIIDAGYPASIGSGWALPDPFASGIDAALQILDKCYFFSGPNLIRHHRTADTGPGEPDSNYHKSLADLPWGGFGADGIDAIIDRRGFKTGFAFKDEQYIEFDLTDGELGPILSNYPRNICEWRWNGFGNSGIDSVMKIGEDYYIFCDSSYIRIREDLGITDVEEFPLPFSVQGDPMPLSGFFQPPPSKKRDVDFLVSKPSWMANLADDISLFKVSLPGTHDSGAIDKWYPTPWGTQAYSITEQLEAGVRLLDIRLQVNPIPRSGSLQLMVCHGRTGLGKDLHVYEVLDDVLNECKAFLQHNNREALVISFKVDDWVAAETPSNVKIVKDTITSMLDTFRYTGNLETPTMGVIRGQVYVLDRIDMSLGLGLPIHITDNTPGGLVGVPARCALNVFAQDRYEGLPLLAARKKARLVFDTIRLTQNYDVVMNFASALQVWILGVYVNEEFVKWMLSMPTKPAQLGWILFDHALYGFQLQSGESVNCVDLVISANEATPYSSYDGARLAKDELGH